MQNTSSLTITLPTDTTVRSVLLSLPDSIGNEGRSIVVSVGETLANNKRCYFTHYGKKITSSKTGLSAWLTCDDLVGSKLFITNPNFMRITLFEIMAFSQYNVMPFATIYSLYSTAATTGSS